LILRNSPPAENLRKEYATSVAELQKIGRQTLLDAGFRYWDENLMLTPEWFMPYIKAGEQLESITGEKVIKGKDPIDDDTRGGLLAYGFRVSKNDGQNTVSEEA